MRTGICRELERGEERKAGGGAPLAYGHAPPRPPVKDHVIQIEHKKPEFEGFIAVCLK